MNIRMLSFFPSFRHMHFTLLHMGAVECLLKDGGEQVKIFIYVATVHFPSPAAFEL